MYETIRVTIMGVKEKFSSQELGLEEPDDGLLDHALPRRVEEAARKDVYQSKQAMAKAMKGNINSRLTDIAWRNRSVFDPVEPGSVKGHTHKIELDTTKELKAKMYPLRLEHHEEARKEIQKLLEKGMIEEVDQSPFQAPIVMVKKKSPEGQIKWRMCIDYRLLNEHTVRDAYPMPALERYLNVGKA